LRVNAEARKEISLHVARRPSSFGIVGSVVLNGSCRITALLDVRKNLPGLRPGLFLHLFFSPLCCNYDSILFRHGFS
jgi:hypothetical protein